MHWEPDEQLVPAALARARHYADLSPADRCWAVAGLVLHGCTSEDIAERLSCSVRTVKVIRSEPMTAVCLWAQREAGAFGDELRLSRSEHRHALLSLDEVRAEAERLRGQVRRLLHPPENSCVRGHDLSSAYARYERGGRTWCRECHRERQAAYRLARRRERSTP